jgi:SAM-dependent methyltransferase
VPAWSYARRTILNPRSRACFWKHPVQAGRMIVGAGSNWLLGLGDRLRRSGRRECPVCRWQGNSFRTFLSPDDVIPGCICPLCGSFDRQRYLALGMREALAEPAAVPRTLLGLSLTPAMSYLLAHEGLGRCFHVDYDRVDARYRPEAAIDLRRAGFATGSFDWIVCSHVLDHIPELEPAVDELVRLLRPGGRAWIQVAYQEGLARSHPIARDPRLLDAHAWRFGEDFTALLARPGWEMAARHAAALAPDVRRRHGIHTVERYWVGRREGS